MNVVVNTALVVESSRLPELAAHLTSMVPVKQVLTDEANAKEARAVGLSTREEGASKVAMVFHAALVSPHLDEAVI